MSDLLFYLVYINIKPHSWNGNPLSDCFCQPKIEAISSSLDFHEMWSVARFGTICTVQKREKHPW